MTFGPANGRAALPSTDFGREALGGGMPPTLEDALRHRARRVAAADARRYHLLMGGAGFAGGLLIAVPAALWLAGRLPLASAPAISGATRAVLVDARPVSTGKLPGSVPGSLTQPSAPVIQTQPPPSQAANEQSLEAAKAMFRNGDVAGARRLLVAPDLAERGEALFLLAETYDPHVLAALGARGLFAETSQARRLYEAARDKGMAAAARRLEALK
jgi:hypothetical protein